jgi:nucleoporin NUP159
MNEFTRLTRPEPNLDLTLKERQFEGFNYPTFRLINKQDRVSLSPTPIPQNSTVYYRLFAIANSKAWFAAVTPSSLLFSPLHDLRLAFRSTNSPFTPKRTLTLSPGLSPTVIAFASADSKLVVAFDAGQLAIYDTSSLLTPGDENVQPLHFLETHAGPLRQIAPNPGTELDFLAVVRGDGSVQLLNTNLESKGGWIGSDMESTPLAGTYFSLLSLSH